MSTKLPPEPTDEQIQSICRYVRLGNYLQTAAMHVGVDLEVVNAWLKLGAEERQRRARNVKRYPPRVTYEQFLRFHNELSTALNAAEVESVLRLRTLARDESLPANLRFRADTFLLERRHPERWAKRVADVDDKGRTKTTDKPISEVVTSAREQVDADDPMTREEAIALLTDIARGNLKTLKSTARGDLFLQPPSFKDRHDAAVTLLGAMDKRGVEDNKPRAVVVRMPQDKLH